MNVIGKATSLWDHYLIFGMRVCTSNRVHWCNPSISSLPYFVRRCVASLVGMYGAWRLLRGFENKGKESPQGDSCKVHTFGSSPTVAQRCAHESAEICVASICSVIAAWCWGAESVCTGGVTYRNMTWQFLTHSALVLCHVQYTYTRISIVCWLVSSPLIILLLLIWLLLLLTLHYQSGGLQFLQELDETVGGKLSEFIVQVHYTTLDCKILYYTALHNTALQCTTLYCATLHHKSHTLAHQSRIQYQLCSHMIGYNILLQSNRLCSRWSLFSNRSSSPLTHLSLTNNFHVHILHGLQINNCYPPEVVEYYSPNYSKTLLQKIDEYQPAM